jgi:hypothetical protein
MYILRICETAPTSNTRKPYPVGVIVFLQKCKIIDEDGFGILEFKVSWTPGFHYQGHAIFKSYQRILCNFSHFFVRNVSLVVNVLCVIS